jgi:hypothetical protein
MKRSSLVAFLQTNAEKKLKYTSLNSNEVWDFDYDLLPDEVIAKVAACVTNKACNGSLACTKNKYRLTCSSALRSWVQRKEEIPREVALRLIGKLSNADLQRLQLWAPVQQALSMLGNDALSNNLATDTSCEVSVSHVVENHHQPSPFNRDDECVYDFDLDEITTRYAALSTNGVDFKVMSTTMFDDELDFAIDPLSGSCRYRPSFKQVIRLWAINEMTVSKACVTRLLHLMHIYQPTIELFEYGNNSIPRHADTLLYIQKTKRSYVIRDFNDYDYENDDFPGTDLVEITVGGDEVEEVVEEELEVIPDEEEVEEDIEELDQQEGENAEDEGEEENCEELLEIGDCPPDLFNNESGSEGDDPESDDSESGETVRKLRNNIPDIDDYAADIEEHVKELIGGAAEKRRQKMVYFGLENILTCSNSAGNIHKGSYINFLRAVALMDETALTDTVVNRIFPPNTKVNYSLCKNRSHFIELNLICFSFNHLVENEKRNFKCTWIYFMTACQYSSLPKHPSALH